MKIIEFLKALWDAVVILCTLSAMGEFMNDHDVPPFDEDDE